MSNIIKTAIVGSPNCGKTTLFNALTGSNQMIGNWPGVTVEKKVGFFKYQGKEITITDLPGIYSINSNDDLSLDEKVARDFVMGEKPDFILNIVDATNLERGLYLTIELLEMQVPMIIVLNMLDIAKKNGVEVDVEALADKFSCPVMEVVASKKQGVLELKELISNFEPKTKYFKINYDEKVENLIDSVKKDMIREGDKRFLAINAIESDKVSSEIDIDLLIADGRFSYINSLVKDTVTHKFTVSKTATDKMDNFVLGKFTGMLFFLFAMYLMFAFSVDLGGMLIDPFVEVSEAVLIDGVTGFLEKIGASELIIFLLANGVGGGIATVISFIPPIAFLFFALSILEDTGYMSRVAFLLDRFMKCFGLSGTAFVPMLVGFGCSVPALMGTRALPNNRDRLLTMMMIPFMSCGARFPVYAVFAAAMFKESSGLIVFSLYIAGIIVALLTGVVLRGTVLEGNQEPMVLELPRYHLPILRNIFITTWQKLKGFVLRAGTFIVPLVLILNILTYVNIDGTVGSENSDKSYLAIASKKVSVIFEPMGVSEKNWPAVVGIVTGLMAKEAVVGTLNALYLPDAGESDVEPEENEDFKARLSSFFDGKVGAYAYLLFILLYVPCLAAVATMLREAGKNWTYFMFFWTNAQAYVVASSFYQIMRFDRNPSFSTIFLLGVVVFEVLVYIGLKQFKKKKV